MNFSFPSRPVPDLRAALVAVLVLGLAGCAAIRPGGQSPDIRARALWNRFAAENRVSAEAFTLKASLNFSTPEKSHRLVLKFWGNFDYPVRLDISTGMGTPFTFWREDGSGWLAYYPQREQAFFHPDGRAGIRTLGLNAPFNLRGLGLILAGRWTDVLPEKYSSAHPVPGGYEYRFGPGHEIASITIDQDLGPVGLKPAGDADCVLSLEDRAENPPHTPRRVKMTCATGETALLRVKDIQIRNQAWSAGSLDLSLPPDTRYYLLPGAMQDPVSPQTGMQEEDHEQ